MKTKGKITLWSILSGVMLVLAIACIVGTFVAERYVSIINSFFNLDNYKIVGKTDPDTDTKYYKSAFLDENGELDEVACDEFVTNISRRTAEEGAVLLWNHDNALPIEAESTVSLFGKSSVVPNYVVDGSGNVKVKDMQDMFGNCSSLTTIKGIIDMKSCKYYMDMFDRCPRLTGVKIKNPPVDFESKSRLSKSQYTIVS